MDRMSRNRAGIAKTIGISMESARDLLKITISLDRHEFSSYGWVVRFRKEFQSDRMWISYPDCGVTNSNSVRVNDQAYIVHLVRSFVVVAMI